ncbi:MAG: Hsp20/alpha crystallin family protein [Candidatus Omnitrophica bacterium]|nr:Hsp20/alpha crystallin family protein [Candidatus Omnitrophota bacterium]
MNLSHWKSKNNLSLPSEFFGVDHPFYGLTLFPELKPFLESSQKWNPAIDVTEEKDQFLIKADVPGIDKKDIELSTEGTILSIKGERKQETETKEKNVHRLERFYGQFTRRLDLGENIDPANIKAKYENGVLKITVKKNDKPVMNKIEIDN